MTGVKTRGEDVRKYILENIEKHPSDVAKKTADHFGVTRQAANKHLQRLVKEKTLTQNGQTRNRTYKLAPLVEWMGTFEIKPGLAEDVIWREAISPILGAMPDNVLNIWDYGFTEMVNNAIDHSVGTRINVYVVKNAATTEIMVSDDGVGIFKKIQKAMGLLDERHAVLELSKGKLTTDPANHTGQGIFFSSRAFDAYQIMSGGVFFSHSFGAKEDWILEIPVEEQKNGTVVQMKLHNHTARTLRKVFDKYTSDDEDYGFNKTVVPVVLAQYGNDMLVSRSQAKRLLARVELFKMVMLDFKDVQTIGQAFADEIFRVFAQKHPEIELVPIKANSEVKRMIHRALTGEAAIADKRLTLGDIASAPSLPKTSS